MPCRLYGSRTPSSHQAVGSSIGSTQIRPTVTKPTGSPSSCATTRRCVGSSNSADNIWSVGRDHSGVNSSVRSLRDTLRSLMTAESTTPTSDGGYSYLHDIGVDIDSAGKLSLTTSTLDTALASNFSDVVYLMTGNQEALSTYDTTTAAGIAGEASRTLTTALSSSGTMTVESANATDRIAKYQEDLTKLEDRMTQLLARYTKQFSEMDSMVGQTKSTQTGLTSSFEGLMAMYTK